MRLTQIVGLLVLLAGCGGDVVPQDVVDAAGGTSQAEVMNSAAERVAGAFSPTVGDPCEPSYRCDVPLPPAEGCECRPPLRYPAATASLGAYCEPTARRCCAWYVVSPVPFTRWENCGDGWKCAGERCP